MQKNKKLIVIIGVVAVLLCICCTATLGGVYLIYQNIAEEEARLATTLEFTSYMAEYPAIVVEGDQLWGGYQDTCNNEDKIDALYEKEVYRDEIDGLEQEVLDLIDEEMNCNKNIRNDVLDLYREFTGQINSINCADLDQTDECTMIVTGLNDVVALQEEMLGQVDVDYADWRSLHQCYINAFRDNFGNNAKQQQEYTKCQKSYPNDYEETNLLNERYNEKLLEVNSAIERFNGESVVSEGVSR